jgi:hypothetical protein
MDCLGRVVQNAGQSRQCCCGIKLSYIGVLATFCLFSNISFFTAGSSDRGLSGEDRLFGRLFSLRQHEMSLFDMVRLRHRFPHVMSSPWTTSTWLDQGETSRRAHVDPKPASASALASDFIVRARGRKVAVTSASRRLLDFCGSGECFSRIIPRHLHGFHSASRFVRSFGKSYTLESPKPRDWLHITYLFRRRPFRG